MPKKNKDVKIFCDITKCVACRTCELACATEHSVSKDVYKLLKEDEQPKRRVRVSATPNESISIHCQHCKDAPCVAACMSGAMHKDEKSSATMHDKEKCVGCWMCVMACPFGAIVRDVKNRIAVKCDLCPDRDDYACVAACPTKALFAGTEEDFKKTLKEKRAKKR
ncbi:MAG: 4Fe-4S dicluster domain-containing protein [Candidatus Omnitrophica bacterium]|nr:4Fe-4S dicluster domain-containing protein [Candidatus Omnitrophota bacterium]